jgi:hypothetical protein
MNSGVRGRSSTNPGAWAEWDEIRIHANFDGSNGLNAKAEWRIRTNKSAKKRRPKSAPGNKESPAGFNHVSDRSL